MKRIWLCAGLLVCLAACTRGPTPSGTPTPASSSTPIVASSGTPTPASSGTPTVAGYPSYPGGVDTQAPPTVLNGSATPPAVPSAVLGDKWYIPIVVAGGVTDTPAVTLTPSLTPTPTLSPTPTLTPTPRWPPALEAPGRSKVALHIISMDSPDIMEFMRVTKPRVVKAVDDFGYIAEIKRFAPETIAVGRILLETQPMEGDPVTRAQAFVGEHLETYLKYPAVDYWEGYNEPSTDPESMTWYSQFEAERTRIMATHGLRVAIGAFATGTPEFDEMVLFLPAMRAAQTYNGILVLHEYSAPTMDYGVGAAIPGRMPVPERGVLTLRYRFFYEELFKPYGITVPLILSEAGIDGGIAGRPGPENGLGWRDFSAYWSEIGRTPGSAGYIEQLAWYDQEVQRDDYVLGFTIFTVGATQNAEWQSFDFTSILPRLARYVVTQAP